MSNLLAVLDKLLWVLLAWKRSSNQKKAQEERDELEDNPGEWIATHFGGRVYDKSNDGSSTNSDKTNAGS